MSTKNELTELLPKILKKEPYGMVAQEIHDKLSKSGFSATLSTIRFNLSVMSKDPLSPVCRAKRRGYVLNEGFCKNFTLIDMRNHGNLKKKIREIEAILKKNADEITIGDYVQTIPILIKEMLEIIKDE